MRTSEINLGLQRVNNQKLPRIAMGAWLKSLGYRRCLCNERFGGNTWIVPGFTVPLFEGHSDMGVTLNTYTYLGHGNVQNELVRVEKSENARKELEKTKGGKPVSQKMFRSI